MESVGWGVAVVVDVWGGGGMSGGAVWTSHCLTLCRWMRSESAPSHSCCHRHSSD